jgi:L-lactate dehydrogenase
VAVQSVHAYVVGEHGDSELPLWSTATIGPIPVADWSVPGVPPLDAAVRDGIAHQVVTAAERIIRGKGATNYAIGLSTARIVEAVLKDEKRILPVSSLLNGQYGVHDVCLSLPTVVDRRGIVSILAPPISDDEQAALTCSAAAVRSAATSLGLFP